MGWLRWVGTLKLQVSFAEYSLLYRYLLQKRPVILRSLLIEATPYQCPMWMCHVKQSTRDYPVSPPPINVPCEYPMWNMWMSHVKHGKIPHHVKIQMSNFFQILKLLFLGDNPNPHSLARNSHTSIRTWDRFTYWLYQGLHSLFPPYQYPVCMTHTYLKWLPSLSPPYGMATVSRID